jgi:hypothetical protein
MAQFAYLGDHEAVTLWGIEFPQGVAVSVSDEQAIGKLRGNSHFSEVFDGVEVMPDAPKPKRKYTRREA